MRRGEPWLRHAKTERSQSALEASSSVLCAAVAAPRPSGTRRVRRRKPAVPQESEKVLTLLPDVQIGLVLCIDPPDHRSTNASKQRRK